MRAGEIVLADWRGDALPNEPNKLRPAVVVGDDDLFVADDHTLILVPLTGDGDLAVAGLSLAIAPTPENGCTKPCWAVSHLVAATSRRRLRATASRITGRTAGHDPPAGGTRRRGRDRLSLHNRAGPNTTRSHERHRHPARRNRGRPGRRR